MNFNLEEYEILLNQDFEILAFFKLIINSKYRYHVIYTIWAMLWHIRYGFELRVNTLF